MKHVRGITLYLVAVLVAAAFATAAVVVVGGQAVARAETSAECKERVTEAKRNLAGKKQKQKEKLQELKKAGKKEKAEELKKQFEEEDAEAKKKIKEKSEKCRGKK